MVSMWCSLTIFSFTAVLRTSYRRVGAAATGALLPSDEYAARRTQQTCGATKRTMATSSSVGYLDAQSASDLDNELMQKPGFCLEQLMELAGLSVAEAVYQIVQERRIEAPQTTKPHVLVVCGPGNNGGDGLVAARHLVMFGYDATILYPKQSEHQKHYANLVQQCRDIGIAVHADMAELDRPMNQYTCIVDAIFGFSFKGEPREPFKTILEDMKQQTDALTVAVDVPSGWNVDQGDVSGIGFMPDVLVSLTAPKLSAKSFTGRHFIGGRFLPPKLEDKYRIRMPDYPGVSQVVEMDREK